MKETSKQLDYIAFIQDETGIIYNGNSKHDAIRYISENKDKVPPSANIQTWAIVNGY